MAKHNPHTPESAIKGIDEQIAYYKQKIADLEMTRKMLIASPPPPVFFYHSNPKLTKDFVRQFMKMAKHPMQTVQVINALYPKAIKEERTRAIRTLSVIFNTLEKDGVIKVTKQKGVKGNFYQWAGMVNPITAAGAGLAD